MIIYSQNNNIINFVKEIVGSLYYNTSLLLANEREEKYTNINTLSEQELLIKNDIDQIKSVIVLEMGPNGIYNGFIKAPDNQSSNYTTVLVNHLNTLAKRYGHWPDYKDGLLFQSISGDTGTLFIIESHNIKELSHYIPSFYLDKEKKVLIHEVLQNNLKNLGITIN